MRQKVTVIVCVCVCVCVCVRTRARTYICTCVSVSVPTFQMQCTKTSNPDHESSSNSSDEYDYVMDPNASEEDLAVYQHSGVSLTYLHGVFYTPPGFKRVKRRASTAHAEHDDQETDQESVCSTSDDDHDLTPETKKRKTDD